MSKSNSYEASILALLFNATAIANIADNAAGSPLTNLYVVLHTADPGETGTQSTNEASYTGYARVAVARTSGGWTISGTAPTQVSPASTVSFPTGSGGSGIATHMSVGSLASGAGVIYYSGTITPNITLGAGITPQLTTATVITED